MTHHDPNRPHHGRVDPVTGRPAGTDPFAPLPGDEPVVSGAEARQAPPGRPVLYVLIAGLVLALIAWAAVEM